jgi:hypothetical protein
VQIHSEYNSLTVLSADEDMLGEDCDDPSSPKSLAGDSSQVEFVFTVLGNVLTVLLTATYAALSLPFLLAVVAEQPWVRRMLEDSTVPVS